MLSTLFSTIFLSVGLLMTRGSKSIRICASHPNNRSHISIDKEHSVDQDEPLLLERCNANSCYTLWKETSDADNNSLITVLAQGCWESSGKEDCGTESCVASHKQNKALNNTKFCCCTEDLCNTNYSEAVGSLDYEDTRSNFIPIPASDEVSRHSQQGTVAVLAACSLTLVAVIVALCLISRRWQGPDRSLPADNLHLIEAAQRSYNEQLLEEIKLSSIIGKGRYGTVWLGYLEDEQVAIKVFPASYKQFYFNERDIYCLPFMDHSSLLMYYGCNERIGLDSVEYLLVISYCSNGCLQDYIRLHTIDFYTFCRMALSIAKGLAFLHTDIHRGDKIKPCVCHRDLNTRNILVKGDLSCVLCDLGLAIKLNGSHYYTLEEEKDAETKSISDVGTLRYMAPEVLEGAVNLRDCESSLKRIDMYALGLVLWELATRCSDICRPASEPPAYSMPFEAEIGEHPSFDGMQELVTRKKARPLFPEVWQDCAATRLLRETIDDCWDQDAEARLTALCVEERLVELSTLNLRGTGQTGISPTINQMHIIAPYSINNSVTNHYIVENDGPDSNLSEGTVETLLTLSPSEPLIEAIANNKTSNIQVIQAPPIQPYQGRNPCFERNLMKDTDKQNEFLDRSMKHDKQIVSDSHSPVNEDYLGVIPRVNNPIPFFQNAVSASETVQTIPKQPNVPRNGVSKKHFGGILSKPIRQFLEYKINRTEKPSKNKSPSQVLKETEVSVDEKNTITAILGNERDSTRTTMDLEQEVKSKDNILASNMKMIISPFEDNSDQTFSRKNAERPSSLPLTNSKNKNTEKSNLANIFTDGNKGKLKDLAGRIKTPGDVPPSVRRKRGKTVLGETRFSLYDDRMMEGMDLSDTERESKSNMTTQSFPSDIQLAGRPLQIDSSF